MEIQICRLCLKTAEENYINIFGEHGTELGIASVLMHHFWFEIKADDNHPKSVCTPCWLGVENFHKLYMQIYNIHNKLVVKFDVEEIKVEEKEVATCIAETEILSENNENIIEIIIPEKNETVEYDPILEDHFGNDYSEEIESNQSDSRSNEIIEPIAPENSKNSEIPLTTKPIKKRKNVKNVGKIGKNDEANQMKREDELIREYFVMECDLCATKFQIFQNVKSHYRITHKLNGYLKCCSRKFFKRCYVLQHIQRHLNPDSFKCEICNKTYLEKRGLQNHMNKHLPVTEKPFKCEKCPKAFAKNFLLKQHQIQHITEKDKIFFCDECGKSFASNSILQSHKRGVHQGAYVHVCEICAKSFKSKLFYETHMKSIHSGETIPKVQCQLCGTWLKHEHSLRSHMSRHEDGNKDHKCNICGKLSPNRGALRSHQQYVHMIGRTHKCSICDKAFKKAVALKEHMTIHTGEVLYKCPHCPKTFNSSANLHSHRKKNHLKEWEANRRCKVINSCEKDFSK